MVATFGIVSASIALAYILIWAHKPRLFKVMLAEHRLSRQLRRLQRAAELAAWQTHRRKS